MMITIQMIQEELEAANKAYEKCSNDEVKLLLIGKIRGLELALNIVRDTCQNKRVVCPNSLSIG